MWCIQTTYFRIVHFCTKLDPFIHYLASPECPYCDCCEQTIPPELYYIFIGRGYFVVDHINYQHSYTGLLDVVC